MGKYFLKSFFFHLMTIGVLYVFGKSYFNFWNWGKKEKILTGTSSIRVDVVAMPKLTLREQKNLKLVPFKEVTDKTGNSKTPTETQSGGKPSSPSPKMAEKKDDSSDTSDLEIQGKEKEKKGKLDDLLKNLSKKVLDGPGKGGDKNLADKKVKDQKGSGNKEGTSPSLANEFKNLLLAGNKLSQGTSAVGNGESGEVTEFTMYIENVLGHIRPHWKLPGYLAEQNLTCRVRIFISREGRVLKTVIYQSSGNSLYDEKALEAIKMAEPLPTPTASIVSRVREGDIILGFPI